MQCYKSNSFLFDYIKSQFYFQNMFKNILTSYLIFILIGFSLSFNLNSQNQEFESSSQLMKITNFDFPNNIGAGVTQPQIDTFKAAVINASILYGINLELNQNYIKSIMNSKEGNQKQNYFIFIQQNTIFSNFSIFTVGGNNYASFRGINPKSPSWSYLFVRVVVSPNAEDTYVNWIGRGEGLYPQVQSFIFNIVQNIETNDSCDCTKTSILQSKMINYDQQRWNVVCDISYDVSALVFAQKQQWVYIKPKQCYYLLFVN